MSLIRTLIIIAIILCVACSKKESKKNSITDICLQNKISNEFIVVYKSGELKVLNKTQIDDLFARANDQLLWYEPNYKIKFVNNKIFNANNIATTQSITKLSDLWPRLGFDNYYNQGFYGQGIKVAVLDTGVYEDSPYLISNYYYNSLEQANGLDDDNNGYIDDLLGWNMQTNQKNQRDEVNHGTQIAHIIAGSKDTPSGIGVAPLAKIIPVDFMDGQGGTEADAILAIDYAISRGANIINNSWSVACSLALRSRYPRWSNENVLLIHASGNHEQYLKQESLNSSNFRSGNYLSVGSINNSYMRATFSNYGPNVLLYTHGVDLLLLAPLWQDVGKSIIIGSGTSYSAAIVSGAAALIWSRNPSWSATKVRDHLLKTSRKVGGLSLLNL